LPIEVADIISSSYLDLIERWHTQGVDKCVQWKSHLQKTKNTNKPQNKFALYYKYKEYKFYTKRPIVFESHQTHYYQYQDFV